MNNKIGCKKSPEGYDAQIFCKSRIVDPLFDDHGTLKRISDVDNERKEVILAKAPAKEYFLKFEQ